MEFFYCRLRGRSKVPLEKDFINKATNDMDTVKAWMQNGDNVGIVCSRSGIVVIDVDVKHGGVDAWAALCVEHGEPVTRIQMTPSGGKHYLFKAKEGKRYKGKIQDGIDIRHNHQIVAPPSILGTNGKAYFWLDKRVEVADYPSWLDDLIEKKSAKSERQQVSNEYLMALAKEIKKYPLGYDDWCLVGMALHSSDSSNVGLDAFIEASLGESYQDGDEEKCAEKWRSFGNEKDELITIKSLCHLIRQKGGTVPTTTSADDFEIISGQESGWIEEDGKHITHSKLDCIELFNKTHSFYMEGGEACIIRNEDIKTMKLKTFFAQHSEYLFRTIKGKKTVDKPAAEVWAQDSRRRFVDRIVFAPTCTDREINLFRGMPKIIESDKSPNKILRLIKESLCAIEEEAEWLLDWLAHVLQKPFEKSTLVPVHITSQGTGKGILYEMTMGKILGKTYFKRIDKSSEITSKFNKDLANKFLTFIDESVWGGNKEVVGILKSITGSETLSVEEKFGATYTVNNPSRYVIVSNNANALDVEVGNRRYVTLAPCKKHAADTEFHQPIADAIRFEDEAECFATFLLQRDISKFNPHKMPDFRGGEDTKLGVNDIVGAFWHEVIKNGDIKLWRKQGLSQKLMFYHFEKWKKDMGHRAVITKIYFGKQTTKLVGQELTPKVCRIGTSTEKFFDIKPRKFFTLLNDTIRTDIPILDEEEYYGEDEEF